MGWRSSDYELTGRSYGRRGELFDGQLRDLQQAWSGEPIAEGTRPVAPSPAREPGIPLLIGGTTEASLRRVAEVAL